MEMGWTIFFNEVLPWQKLGTTRTFQLLTRATQDSSTAEHAWLWLSGVVSRDEERLFCLGNVLRINPNNEHAKPAANGLRQKGIFPSPPMPPAVDLPPVPAIEQISTPQSSPQPPVLASQPMKMNIQLTVTRNTANADKI
jgi:hypothetical protein